MTCRDEASPLAVEGVADCEFVVADITVCGKVWGIKSIPKEEGVTLFLRPQIRPIYCGRLHLQPVPGLFRPLQSTCALDRGPFQCRCQCLLYPMLTPSPNRRPTLPETGRGVCRPELHLAPECCNEVSCDDTGRRPVFRGRLIWVGKGQSCLFY